MNAIAYVFGTVVAIVKGGGWINASLRLGISGRRVDCCVSGIRWNRRRRGGNREDSVCRVPRHFPGELPDGQTQRLGNDNRTLRRDALSQPDRTSSDLLRK